MKNTRELRAWLYSILVSAGPLVSFYGVATHDEITLWLGLGGTLLGVPAGTTALANLTPKAATVTDVDGLISEMHAEGEAEIPVPEEITDDELAGIPLGRYANA